MFWRNRKFKEEQSYWYDVLKSSGFEDIEVDENRLKQSSQNIYRNDPEPIARVNKLEYFLKLSQYMREKAPEFDDSLDYFVMSKFSQGWKNIEIVRALKALGKPRDRRTIRFIRRKYEHRWGIREWTPKQINPNLKN